VDSTYRSEYQTESRSYLLRESLLGAWEKQAGQAKALLDAMDGQGRFREQGRTASPASAPLAGLGEPVSVRQTKVTVTPADPTVRLETGLGHHLRADTERALAVFKSGNVTVAELLVDKIIQNFEALMTQPATNYHCFRNAAEQQRFADTNPGIGQVVWMDWRYCEILQFRAFIHAQRKQFEKALQVLDKAIQVGPDNAVAHNERGYILVQMSRFQEALRAYELAQEASKRTGGSRIEEAAALRGMGATWVDLGDLDKAEKALNESLLLEPGNAVARNELEYIRQLRSRKNDQPTKP
jgi:tetratricopeptide (TPR) repeat protein